MEANFINELRKTNYSLVEECGLKGLEEKYQNIVNEIYEKKNSKCLKGKEAD